MTGTSNGFLALTKRAGLDGFILALIGMIGLARLWPAAGDHDSPLPLAAISNYGVSFIFFFYGLRLSPEKLRAGLSNWKLHLVVHVTTFIVFPAIILAARALFGDHGTAALWTGLLFLGSLPSTVSSSVVMVSIAGGNMPAAIFNASISSLLGVFITPLWMSLVPHTASAQIDIGGVMGKLVLQVLVPVVLGIIMHKRWGSFAERYKKALKYFDQAIILLIVYTSFCESFSRKMFSSFSISDLLLLGLAMIALFFFVYSLTAVLGRLLRFSTEDRITAIFCGSKKSLVHGTVMSKVLFPASDQVGIILLPIMLYHALQLIAASILAQSMAKRKIVTA